MAIDQGTEVIEVTTLNRSSRIAISSQYRGDVVWQASRETIRVDKENNPLGSTSAEPVIRLLSVVGRQKVTVPGTPIELTVAQLTATIIDMTDTWQQEDQAAPPDQPPLRGVLT